MDAIAPLLASVVIALQVLASRTIGSLNLLCGRAAYSRVPACSIWIVVPFEFDFQAGTLLSKA